MPPKRGDLGRFQRGSRTEPEVLDEMVAAKPELRDIPVLADASFGHTTPQFTLPVGGRVRVAAVRGAPRLHLADRR